MERIFDQPPVNETQKEKLRLAAEAIKDMIPASQLISAARLQDLCKAALIGALQQTRLPWDAHAKISLAAQKLGFAMPTPILFADTNWVKDEFGLSSTPGAGKLQSLAP